MPTRPSQGGSAGTWGTELNAWLDVAHNADGTLKAWVTPEDFGAVGNGTTDDTAALELMAASGKPIRMTRGKTYLQRRVLNFLTAGLMIDGNGATLKRAPQVSTTTTTTITGGTTTAVTVASTTGFQVGDPVAFSNGGNYDDTITAPSPKISSIVGSVLNLDRAINSSFSGTTTVYTVGMQMLIEADNITVTDLIFEGNRSNWTWARWANTIALYVVGPVTSNNCVQRCSFLNQPGDALAIINTVKARVAFNTFTSCGGRGVSLGSTATGARVVGNDFTSIELDATVYQSPTFGTNGSNDGHGCVQLSNPVSDLLVQGNKMDTGIVGVGSLSTTDNSDVTITENEIRAMSSFAIDGVTGTTSVVSNVVISNNRIYNCGAIQIATAGGASTQGNSRWIVTGNVLVETPILVQCSKQVIVRGNTLYSAGTTLNMIRLANGGGTTGTIDSTVDGNIIVGGAVGVLLDNYTAGCLVVGNRLSNQLTYAIQTSGASGTDILIANNIINAGAATTNSTNGITISGQHEVRNNIVNLGTSTGNNAIQVAGTCVRARVIGNTCITRSAVNPLVVFSGATATELRDNTMSGPYSNAGTNTIRVGNRINPTNLVSGRAVLAAGTVTVSTGEVLTADNISLTHVVAGGTLGVLSVGTIVDKTSFVINSSSGTDTSTVYWEIRH